MPSREVWSLRVSAWKSSGLTAPQFAARHHLDARSLYFWSSALRRSPPSASPVHFAQLVPAPAPLPSSPLEVLLASGHVLRVRSGFDPALLRAVVEALEAP